ncbi:MAG: neuromedin U [Candidatus Sulfotelmatobacter sp.]
MITNLLKKQYRGEVATSVPPPIGRFWMPYVIALHTLLWAVTPHVWAQQPPPGQQSVVTNINTSLPVIPAASEQPQSIDVHDVQNPVASLISVPFQGDTYFNYGPYRRTANVLLIEPVIPFRLSEKWNLIVRAITPLISEPRISPSQDSQFGLGNLQPQFYLSPAHAGKILWGLGPQLWLPTATDKSLGVNKWGGGPAGAALTIHGPWVVGALVNNQWAGSGNNRVNQLSLNPFANYNLPKGWYFISSGITTADWTKPTDRWTVPIGGGIGRLFRIGLLPVNARVQFLNNVVRPLYTPTWQVQYQVQFLLPAGSKNKKH